MSGIKITDAIIQNGSVISAISYHQHGGPLPIYCPDNNCHAELSHVKGYKRESYGRVQHIPPFYRLKRHFDHSENCQFSTKGQTTLKIDYASFNIKNSLKNGDRIFRIHLLQEADKRNIIKNFNQIKNTNNLDRTERSYIKKSKIYPYIREMDGLKELYLFGLNNVSERNKIKIIINTNSYAWGDFFFERKGYGDLLKIIEALPKEPYYYAAIVGYVFVKKIVTNGFEFIELKDKSNQYHPRNNVVITLKLSKHVKSTLPCFNFSQDVIVFSKFKKITVSAQREIDILRGEEIRTVIYDPLQIIFL